jgi:hypothetical protein
LRFSHTSERVDGRIGSRRGALRRNRRGKGFRRCHGHWLHRGLAVVRVTHRRSRGLSHRRRSASSNASERILIVRRLRGDGRLSVRRRRRSTIILRRRLRCSHYRSIRRARSRWRRSPEGRRLPRHSTVRITRWRKRRVHIKSKLIERVGHGF